MAVGGHRDVTPLFVPSRSKTRHKERGMSLRNQGTLGAHTAVIDHRPAL